MVWSGNKHHERTKPIRRLDCWYARFQLSDLQAIHAKGSLALLSFSVYRLCCVEMGRFTLLGTRAEGDQGCLRKSSDLEIAECECGLLRSLQCDVFLRVQSHRQYLVNSGHWGASPFCLPTRPLISSVLYMITLFRLVGFTHLVFLVVSPL